MRRLLHALLLLCLTATGAYAQTGTAQTKTQLNTESTTNFPDNTTGLITPLLTRQMYVDLIASMQQAGRVNAQTGTTYTVVVDDYGKLVTFNNASTIAVTLPQAIGSFFPFNTYFCTTGAGSATITPTTSTINGAATLVLATGQCAQAISDGTNYQIFPGPPPPAQVFNEPGFNNCGLSASVATNILTVNLTDAAGNTPSTNSKCQISFRNSTATTGSLVIDNVTSALSINTVAVGATLGSPSNTAFRFWIVAFDNGGTPALGLYNASLASSCKAINESVVQSSTVITGGATSGQTFYTTSALTNKSIRILGFLEYNSTGLATAGTYTRVPDFLNVMGVGSKKPCDVVQVATSLPTPNDTTVTTTFVITTTNIQITPASAANPLMVNAMGICSKVTAGFTTTRLSRGNSNNTNMIGASSQVLAGVNSACVMEAFDLPNTAASQTYTVQFLSTDGNTAIWGNTNPVFIKVMEVMG